MPRHAATVVLLRPGPACAQVYMLRRSAKSPFMPSTLVFPGGRLDDEDGDPGEDATWERAGQRECREEAGVDLEGHALRWFDTWLTPSIESSRRYLARFYVVALRGGEGDQAQADGHETHAGRWATAVEHLAAWERADVDLPPPTVAILLQLRRWEQLPPQGDPIAAILRGASQVDPRGPILPKVAAIDGAPVILMPHDPEYDATPGQALPAPARVAELPRRFERIDGGWRPR